LKFIALKAREIDRRRFDVVGHLRWQLPSFDWY
jgi:hypothetical protein